MAIPGIPTNFYVQQANIQALCSWDAIAGATSYSVQRSTDGLNFTSLSTPIVNKYLDTTVVSGSQYWYKVASVNTDGTSGYTSAGTVVPAPSSELSLLELRLRAQQKADRVNSNFVTTSEWNAFIGLAMYELYDLLVTAYEDYFMAPRARFQATSDSFVYPLPNGVLSFTDISGSSFVAQPIYKLLGVDLALSTASNAFVTVDKYNLIDRNNYVYPNSSSQIYGVFNLRYRMMGTNIEFIPTPAAGQTIQLLYIPRLPTLLQDTDITTIGFSGWLQYVIVRAAKYALDKEESDTSKLDAELLFLKKRIEETSQDRDSGRPDTISNVRNSGWGPQGGFSPFGSGGW